MVGGRAVNAFEVEGQTNGVQDVESDFLWLSKHPFGTIRQEFRIDRLQTSLVEL
jgi:hypothetical protein